LSYTSHAKGGEVPNISCWKYQTDTCIFTDIPPIKGNFKNRDENTVKTPLTYDYTTTRMGYAELGDEMANSRNLKQH
jgi:hypothetical protein